MKIRLPRRKKAQPDNKAVLQLTGAPVEISGNNRIPLRLLIDGTPEIRHIIEHKPRPRPTTIVPILRDEYGREWRCGPINCDGRHTVPVYFPLSWLSGRELDAAKQCTIYLELQYLTTY